MYCIDTNSILQYDQHESWCGDTFSIIVYYCTNSNRLFQTIFKASVNYNDEKMIQQRELSAFTGAHTDFLPVFNGYMQLVKDKFTQ